MPQVCDYLGGEDHFEVDRARAEQVIQHFPQVRDVARANRVFLGVMAQQKTGPQCRIVNRWKTVRNERRPLQDSNLRSRLRRAVLYPLS